MTARGAGTSDTHPAVAHWTQLTGEPAELASVTLLEHEGGMPSKTAVYRLHGVGAGHGSVVAKRSRLSKATVERTVYERVLPHLSLPALAYYGCVEEPGTVFAWQFLEDARGRAWSVRNDRDRALAASWLATLHGEASALTDIGLRRKDPAYFLELVRTTRATITTALDSSVSERDSRLLRSVVRQCDLLDERWDHVAQLCVALPETVMHGDFTAKNLRILNRGGEELVAFDWEGAGWGVPTLDVQAVRAADYHAAIRARWPFVSEEDLRAVRTAGRILWHLLALRWAARDVGGPMAETALAKLDRHHQELGQALSRMDDWPAS
jgi:hypothetical protein